MVGHTTPHHNFSSSTLLGFLGSVGQQTFVFLVAVIELPAEGPYATDGGLIQEHDVHPIVHSPMQMKFGEFEPIHSARWSETRLSLLHIRLHPLFLQITLDSPNMNILSITNRTMY